MSHDLTRSYREYLAHVPKEHLEAHAKRIALDQQAIDNPDYMSLREEEEWTRRFREKNGNTINT